MLEARDRRRAGTAPPPDDHEVRILLLHANGMGGTIRTVFNLAGYLARTHDVEIVSVVREREEPFFPVPPGVRIRYLDDRLPRRRGLLSRFPSLLVPKDEAAFHWFTLRTDLKLVRYIRSRRGGVLIGTRPGLNLVAARFAPPEVVTVAQEHGNLAGHQPGVRGQIMRRYGRLDAHVTLTETDLRAYERAYGKAGRGTPRVLARIPNAVTRLDGGVSPLTATTAVTVGRLTHVKGYDLLIRAWAHVAERHPDWTLRIYGGGPRREKLQASIDKRGLTDTVVLEGPADDVGGALAAASMFVLSSRREGMPMVVLEAMSKGLPVVSYDCPTGPSELITHGLDGLLVKPEKIHALADAICSVIEDEDLRRKLGRRAQETAAAYDIEVIGARWEALLDRLVRARLDGGAVPPPDESDGAADEAADRAANGAADAERQVTDVTPDTSGADGSGGTASALPGPSAATGDTATDTTADTTADTARADTATRGGDAGGGPRARAVTVPFGGLARR
ncbi:glycosyltransferase family 4 protein [Microbispora corallina]|uniref:glycosyltransferase family 4 protein n=1 Tax=Microbispora corallina TaxID=83302 RepID=UPI001EF2EA1A|nr:glycosyltransferase family 4 protein [Microbispora corallina]